MAGEDQRRSVLTRSPTMSSRPEMWALLAVLGSVVNSVYLLLSLSKSFTKSILIASIRCSSCTKNKDNIQLDLAFARGDSSK